MEYVGWKDVNSAMRYIEAPDLYGQQKIEQGLSKIRPQAEENKTKILKLPVAKLQVHCALQKYHKGVRNLKAVRENIEQFCLKPLGMIQGNQTGYYFIYMPYRDNDHLNELVDDLLHELYESAADQQCLLEANIQDMKSKKMWS
ncbi:hypothetical protein NKI27_10305 [Alkalimarinus alittae]|uniref:Uncharacterized protein n=2 Tax=Alkalimarinus alittae TaxID=2961619 RepID=A0ABY6MXF9_9ALTE|nr:hypothetical protein NKI27_10305 [Alkalimarinus alittae]